MNIRDRVTEHSSILTVADILVFVMAVVAVDMAVTDEQVANTLREITSTAHLTGRTLII